jgi:cell division protein FtsI/penicillin-binding protein 2
VDVLRSLDPKARVALAATVAVLAVIVFMVVSALTGPQAKDAVDEFLAAYGAGDYDAAAETTDGDPAAVAAALEANVEGLDGATLSAAVESVIEDGDEAQAIVRMSWTIPDIGAFEYSNSRLRLNLDDDEWRIEWAERVVHPELEADERLGTVEIPPPRAPILDREGRELVSLQPVVEVGVVPEDLEDPEAAVAEIAELTGADEDTFQESVDAADPGNFVPAITLRQEEFDAIEQELSAIPGTEFGERELPLAPTRDFARALLGTVGPATEEQIAESDGVLDIDDQVGQGGLQAAFEEQLAGTPERSVVIRDAAGDPVDTLHTVDGEPGEALQTTLDLQVQGAAEKALNAVGDGSTGLVAVEPSSGDILAVANRPTDDGFNRAMAGQYPPGSTFKVITTTALLGAGLDPDETVDCPETIIAGGREFVNFEGSAAGAVPFSTDFAQSCNTAFVSLADRLEPDSLRETAEAYYGFGADLGYLPVEAFSGDVPRGRDETEEAAAMIGQARILASPLTMAGVAAAVQAGAWRQPRLIGDDAALEGEPLPVEDAETLRTLMRSVITSGTGTALISVLGEPIGKSGTAEYGSGDPPPTHAWFIAARQGIAVAVIVEDGESGGEVAAPIVADFLSRLG